jgi:hypothetical protein
MMSDPDHVRDEEIVTVRGEGPPDTAHPQDADSAAPGISPIRPGLRPRSAAPATRA